MNKIRIYMIDPDKPGSAQYMFLDRKDIQPDLYHLVYEGEEDTTQLEELFYRFNQEDKLNSIKCRSLSVSDIVAFENSVGMVEGYVCRMIGWERLSDNLLKQLEEKK